MFEIAGIARGAACVLVFARTGAVPAGAFSDCIGLLPDDQRAEISAIRPYERRLVVLLRKLLTRATLSEVTGYAPEKLVFMRTPLGKSELAAPEAARPYHFSSAATKSMAVCLAARDREAGVDVEWIGHWRAHERIAEGLFSAAEAADIARRRGADRNERFFAYWTLKEAYAKQRGLGLRIDFSTITFFLDGDAAPRLVDTGRESDSTFGCVALSPQHRAAWSLAANASQNALMPDIHEAITRGPYMSRSDRCETD